jgi:hypothetical protein
MRTMRLAPLFLLFLFVGGGPALLPLNEAFAGCCKYCKCKWGCTCPGLGSCPTCRLTGDSEITKTQGDASAADVVVDMKFPRKPISSSDAKPDGAEKFITIVPASTCALRDFAWRILGEAGEALKVEGFDVGDKKQDHQVTILQIAANNR